MAAQSSQDMTPSHDLEEDYDEGLGSGIDESSTASLRSSILEFRKENGRTYHSYQQGKYSLPNDEAESDRLDLQHHVFLYTYEGKLGLCPLNELDRKVGRVLDVGCGTGLWAIDYAYEHPEAEVVGVDLSPIQPLFVPPNVRFEIDDLEEPWTFSRKFDYIHSRIMTLSFTNWKDYLQKCYDNLEPGGYLELQEIKPDYSSDDGTLLDTHATQRWRHLLMEAAEKRGRPFTDPTKNAGLLKEIGFVDVQETLHKWPLNTWPADKKMKELGAWTCENIMEGMEGFSLALLSRELGWSREEIGVFLVEVRKCLRDRRIHAYMSLYTVYGRKPS